MSRPGPWWLDVARSYIGTKEVPGPRNSPVIMGWLKALNVLWLGGDAAPWCGSFLAMCMQRAFITPPKNFFRAKEWLKWGVTLDKARLAPGAVLIFDREGGGHVALYTGETPTHYRCLGGNQGDAVNERLFPKARCIGARWPGGVHITGEPVRLTAGGAPVTTGEA